jgi:hypothetical protein
MRIDSSGNVGIGTESPDDALHIHDSSGAYTQTRFTNLVTGATNGDGVSVGVENATGKSFIWNIENTDMYFGTNNIERMVIGASGNVGIGAGSPQAALHIHNGTGSYTQTQYTNAVTGAGSTDGFGVGVVNADGEGFLWNSENKAIYFGTNNSERMRIAADGNVGIGTDPQAKLHVNGNLRVDTLNAATATQVCIDGNNVLSACSSSLRYKENVLDLDSSLELLLRLRPVSYDWIKSKEHDVGFIAEEVEKVDPRLVTYNKEKEIQGVKYDQLTAPIVKAIQDLYYRIVGIDRDLASVKDQKADKEALDALKAENNALRARVDKVEKENAAIKAYLCAQDKNAPICK